MPNFKRIGGGPWKYGQKSDDLTWNDPNVHLKYACTFEVHEKSMCVACVCCLKFILTEAYFEMRYENCLNTPVVSFCHHSH